MKLNEFFYELPQELIAQYPLPERDKARLLVVDRKNNKISHDVFGNLSRYLPMRSLLVLNDSKVVAARLLGEKEKTKGEVEILLLKQLDDGYSFETLMRPLKRLKLGEKIFFNGGGIAAQIIDKDKRVVRFNKKNIFTYLKKIGHLPLPPYIRRLDSEVDKIYYQTVFARSHGSVASPTAGLHFTKELLANLQNDGHAIQYVTLHINYATFKPVEEEDIENHTMHTEEYRISRRVLNEIIKAKEARRSVVAVGTTSCRVLETVASSIKNRGNSVPLKGTTSIFIFPGYQFQLTDILLTNFHQPHSTLLMLVYAFGSKDLIRKAYDEAIQERYRFFSYGDAMVII